MAEDEVIERGEDTTVVIRRRHPLHTAILWVGRIVAVLLLLVAAAVLYLNTGSGRQFIVNQIAGVSPASGLKVSVGRIEGSVLWNATLYDVKFRDAKNKLFLTVPAVELNWRPYKFPFSGLDVRSLVLHHGTLYAKPTLNPGNPNAPTLPASTKGTTWMAPPRNPVWMRASADSSTSERPPIGTHWSSCGPMDSYA